MSLLDLDEYRQTRGMLFSSLSFYYIQLKCLRGSQDGREYVYGVAVDVVVAAGPMGTGSTLEALKC